MTVRFTVSTNLGDMSETFSMTVRGIRRYDRSRTADGRTVSLWTGRGIDSRGMAPNWRRSRASMFRTQGASTGTPWRDYTDEEAQYAAIKGSIFGRRVGKASGDLNRWIRGRERLVPSMVSSAHSENVERGDRSSLLLGTRVPYAADLHSGRGRAPRHLGGGRRPARPLFAIGRPLRADWQRDVIGFTKAHTAAIGTRMSKADILNLAAR